MASITSNPALFVMVVATFGLFTHQLLRGKKAGYRSRLLLCGFGAMWLFVLFDMTTQGHTRQEFLPGVFVVFAAVGGLLRWKMWSSWAEQKSGGNKIVFEDPGAGSGSDVAPPPPMPPAGWFADTSSRHQLRYWDGSQWTDHVSDNGTSTVDPVR